MIMKEKSPLRFGQLGALLFALQAHVYLFGLPPFHAGYWYNQEPRLLAVFLFSILNCAWLGYGVARQWLTIPRPIPTYFKLILAWVGWQIIVTFSTATSSWRSWFGSGMYGEGTAFYLAITLLAIVAYALWPKPAHRKTMIFGIVSAIFVMGLTQLTGLELSPLAVKENPWQVILWPDYLAFLVGWAWMIILFSNPGISINRQLLLTVVACAVALASMNKTAWLLYPIASIATLLILRLQERRPNKKPLAVPNWARPALCLLCLLPLLYTAASYNPNTGDRTSLEQRMHFNAIGLRAILDDPTRLIAGHGWNSYPDDHIKYAVMSHIEMYKDGKFKPNDMSVFGTSLHSHNQPLEAFLVLGLPGFIIWFAMALYVIIAMPQAYFWRVAPIHVAMVILSYFWFPLSFFYAFIALYWAALMHVLSDRTEKVPAKASTPQWPLAAIIPLGFVMFFSAIQYYNAMTYGMWLRDALREPYQEYRMQAIMEDAGRGGERLRAIASDYLDDLNFAAKLDRQVPDDTHRWIERLLDAGYLLSLDRGVGLHAGSLDIVIQVFLQREVQDERYNRARADSFLMYPATVVRIAKLAPQREDLASPYLYHLDQVGDKDTLSLILARLRDAYPQHRTAKWLTGKLLYEKPETKQIGLELMKEALDAGVERIYPITEKERWKVLWEFNGESVDDVAAEPIAAKKH